MRLIQFREPGPPAVMQCLLPVIGKQGIAQLFGLNPPTFGTSTNSRPICCGSALLTTVPRYLPPIFYAFAHVRRPRLSKMQGEPARKVLARSLLSLSGLGC